MPNRRTTIGALTLALVLCAATPATAAAAPTVPRSDIMPHLTALQRIADEHGGNRAHGTSGYTASVRYVRDVLDDAGFRTRLQTFEQAGRPGYNLIADWPGGDEHEVVFLGAHLDSVAEGPGLNDNGSGSAATLAAALAVAKAGANPRKHLRFAWWGAEETGLHGSKHYVDTLNPQQREDIDVYLNFDMTGTKNHEEQLLIDTGTPAASVLREYFEDRQIPVFEVGVGGSDHVSFDAGGIPVSGFSTGLGSCYHQPCDTVENVDPEAETTSTNAVVHSIWELADVG